jgi:methyl-accepting chemotaxis protein
MSIKTKMLVYILLISSVIYILAVGYISYKLKTNALNDAKDKIDAIAKEYANSVKADLNVDMIMSRGIAQALETYYGQPLAQWKEQQNEILKNIIQKNPQFLSVWTNWELNYVWPNYQKDHGRIRLTYYRINNVIKYKEEVIDTVPGFTKGAYYDVKEKKEELVMDPYYFPYSGIAAEEILETSVGVPIMHNNEFIGLAGIDLSLERFQPVIGKIKPYDDSYAFLLANNGTYIAYPDADKVGTVADENVEADKDIPLLQNIKEGKSFSFIRHDEVNNSDYYVSYAPIYIGKATTPWSFGLAVPVNVVMQDARQAFQRAIIVGVIGLLLVAFVIWLIANNISNPIQRTTQVLGDLALGVIDRSKKLKIRSKDEIGQMSESVNTLIEGLNKTAGFAREIGKGNLDKEFELLSEHDALGNSLLEMRESLKEARKKEDERKQEEEKQNWATKGLAKFGDILRQNTDSMEEFGYSIISNLVKYVEANQGALFVINDDDKDDKHIEMLAAYAYDRRKHIEKRIEFGEGLVGRCIQEQQTIHMTDLPEDYINITSGLGHANPKSLVIVPLKVNDEVYGAVELAGFKEFEQYVIKFIEDVGEDIASTIKTTKINIQTNNLLEQSQQQSEELSAQEEEMRQNMEELKATQEEAARRSAEMEGLINALKKSNYVIEYDMDGKILEVNDNYLDLLNMKRDELVGLHHTDYKDITEEEREQYEQFWEDLNKGKTKKETSTIKIGNKKYTFIETYTPITDQYGNPEKVLKIATDITDAVKKK